jgi:hypothetical protein
MLRATARKLLTGVAAITAIAFGVAYAQQAPRGKSSYMEVEINEPFSAIFARLSAEKPEVTRQHTAILNERYDLSNRPAAGITMDRTKPVQEGVRVKLPAGKSWEALAAMSPEQIREQNAFPKGFYPLPHPKHSAGGFVFPHFVIDEIKHQEARDLTRFDVEYDIPDHFLPEFPPANSSPSRTITSCSMALFLPSSWKACACLSRRFRSSSSTRRKIVARRSQAAAQRASTAIRTAIPTKQRILLPMPGPKNPAIASALRRCAACKFSGCSARSGRSRPSRISRSSNRRVRISTVTT